MTVILAPPPPPFSLRHAMHPKPSRFSMAMHGHFLPIPQPPSSILQHLETTMAAIEALNDKSGLQQVLYLQAHRVGAWRSAGGSLHPADAPPQQEEAERTVLAPPRPRCHPLKPRDPFALVSPPKKASSGSGKPRGRPPEKPKVGTSSAPAPATGASRPRGWPPKAKPAALSPAVVVMGLGFTLGDGFGLELEPNPGILMEGPMPPVLASLMAQVHVKLAHLVSI
ncbi:hypothetical protein CK203_112056 [Vitis vinifera]|uniref:Uncharacterized protein n=1 Tax=Vitis vinifera TaxID=29760 RepID=A0A438BLQ6_VITVI|nr:hypothetical protein CK203_112056 [Vitis vinifera]